MNIPTVCQNCQQHKYERSQEFRPYLIHKYFLFIQKFLIIIEWVNQRWRFWEIKNWESPSLVWWIRNSKLRWVYPRVHQIQRTLFGVTNHCSKQTCLCMETWQKNLPFSVKQLEDCKSFRIKYLRQITGDAMARKCIKINQSHKL